MIELSTPPTPIAFPNKLISWLFALMIVAGAPCWVSGQTFIDKDLIGDPVNWSLPFLQSFSTDVLGLGFIPSGANVHTVSLAAVWPNNVPLTGEVSFMVHQRFGDMEENLFPVRYGHIKAEE